MERHASARFRADHDPTPACFSNATILIVEDDDNSLFVLKDILKTKGYRVLEACDGKQAVMDMGDWGSVIFRQAAPGTFDAAANANPNPGRGRGGRGRRAPQPQ